MTADIDRALDAARREMRKPVLIRVVPGECWSKGGVWTGYRGVPVDYCTSRPNVLTEDGAMYPIEAGEKE